MEEIDQMAMAGAEIPLPGPAHGPAEGHEHIVGNLAVVEIREIEVPGGSCVHIRRQGVAFFAGQDVVPQPANKKSPGEDMMS